MFVPSNQARALLGLDIGTSRTGVAIVRSVVMIPSPFTTINNQETIDDEVADLVRKHDVVGVVVGLPRSMDGNETKQTLYVRSVADRIGQKVTVPVFFVDEAVTSVRAEEELRFRRKSYKKEDIDMLSATYMLEDFLQQNPKIFNNVS